MSSLIPWKRQREVGQYGGAGIAPSATGELSQFRNEFDRLWDRFFTDLPTPGDWMLGDWTGSQRWGFDVEDREHEWYVRAEAPGFEPNDFDVQIVGNQLVVTAEQKQEQSGEGRSSYRYGQLRRRITLPAGMDTEHVEAKYHNGVLEVRVPKTEQAKPKRIAVNG